MRKIFQLLIRAYQWLAPVFKTVLPYQSGCVFVPSCSEYALQALEQKGALHGTWLGFKRICRCHPFSAGGVDLPEKNLN